MSLTLLQVNANNKMRREIDILIVCYFEKNSKTTTLKVFLIIKLRLSKICLLSHQKCKLKIFFFSIRKKHLTKYFYYKFSFLLWPVRKIRLSNKFLRKVKGLIKSMTFLLQPIKEIIN